MRRIKAQSIYYNGKIREKAVLVFDQGILQSIEWDATEFDEEYQGLAFAGFVNAHCHLELSHLARKLPKGTGLVDFILGVQKFRESPRAEQLAAMEKMDQAMHESGVVAVGDISNGSLSFEIKSKSKIHYHTFIEQIGFVPGRAESIVEQAQKLKHLAFSLGLNASITPHAPYSVSQALFRSIANIQEDFYSLHHLESAEEIEFFEKKQGDFVRLYEEFKIDIDFFEGKIGNATPYWLDNFRVQKLMLVHNTYMKVSIDLIKAIIPELYLCFCPNANLFIENRLPDIASWRAEDIKICIGTDSLASNDDLSVLTELKTAHRYFPEIPLQELLQWSTINAAEALNLNDQYGDFIPGKTSNLFLLENYLDFQNSTVRKVI